MPQWPNGPNVGEPEDTRLSEIQGVTQSTVGSALGDLRASTLRIVLWKDAVGDAIGSP
jgi:hypothetical protein